MFSAIWISFFFLLIMTRDPPWTNVMILQGRRLRKRNTALARRNFPWFVFCHRFMVLHIFYHRLSSPCFRVVIQGVVSVTLLLPNGENICSWMSTNKRGTSLRTQWAVLSLSLPFRHWKNNYGDCTDWLQGLFVSAWRSDRDRVSILLLLHDQGSQLNIAQEERTPA